MKRVLSIMVALAVMFLVAAPCFAENCLDKLGRGLINSATGWGEFPKQIVETSQEHNIAVGLTWGQLKGAGMAVIRSSLGAYDTGTFYLPYYDKPVMEPEHLFE